MKEVPLWNEEKSPLPLREGALRMCVSTSEEVLLGWVLGSSNESKLPQNPAAITRHQHSSECFFCLNILKKFSKIYELISNFSQILDEQRRVGIISRF